MSQHNKEIAEKCLDMIKFGMTNTLVIFQEQYWEYGGKCDVEEKGLTISDFESAWLADLVATYILESTVDS